VPIRRSGTFCLYNTGDAVQARLEFFNLTGALSARLESSAPHPCWSAAGLSEGMFYVRIETIDPQGNHWRGTQKVLVNP
jgi:hypothetical protein